MDDELKKDVNIKLNKIKPQMQCFFINPNTQDETEKKLKRLCLQIIEKYNIKINY